MALPYFFVRDLNGPSIVLDEETSRHMIGVLRMQKGEHVLLTDGQGNKAEAMIVDDHKKKCRVEISHITTTPLPPYRKTIAVSLLKNVSRFEWFLEKATEMGITEIIPLQSQRTITEKFRHERLQQILISAMLQSQQSILPVLHTPQPFSKVIQLSYDQRLIAHCEDEQNKLLLSHLTITGDCLILIGPEGDFTREEIQAAMANNFLPVSLGANRLRTETAALVAAVLLCQQ